MNRKTLYIAIMVAATAVGCAPVQQSTTDNSAEVSQLKAELVQQQAEKDALRAELAEAERNRKAAVAASTASSSAESMADLPMNARPGECYARVFEPPQYTTETRQMLKKTAGEELDIIPATYEWVEETVMTKPAGMRLETKPARYEWAEQTLVVEPERVDLIEVPAQYDTVSEQVLVKEAYTTWKKGRGPIERINEATGEIMCLVEVPAQYKTVTRTVMTSAPTTREDVNPAKFKTVRTQVMIEPAKTIEIAIPAEYETIKVRKMVTPAREVRRAIPEVYQSVTETKLVHEGNLRWQPILCETNASPQLITRVQKALHSAGYDAGPVDGKIGDATLRAVTDYQRANGLASGQLTIETLKALKIDV